MNKLGAIFALSMIVGPALAQDLPVFDEALGFDVRGTVDDGLILSNGGHVFYCEVEEGPEDRFFVLDFCAPIVGPKAAIAAAGSALSEARDEQSLILAMENMAAEAFVPAVASAFQDFDCSLEFRRDEDAFLEALAGHLVTSSAYDGPLTADMIDAIGELTEDTAELMVDRGQILLDQDSGTAQLVDCP